MMRASVQDMARLTRYGYRVERLDCGFGPAPGAWVLLDPDGASLMIGEYGGVAPTQWEAVAEGLDRIDQEEARSAR